MSQSEGQIARQITSQLNAGQIDPNAGQIDQLRAQLLIFRALTKIKDIEFYGSWVREWIVKCMVNDWDVFSIETYHKYIEKYGKLYLGADIDCVADYKNIISSIIEPLNVPYETVPRGSFNTLCRGNKIRIYNLRYDLTAEPVIIDVAEKITTTFDFDVNTIFVKFSYGKMQAVNRIVRPRASVEFYINKMAYPRRLLTKNNIIFEHGQINDIIQNILNKRCVMLFNFGQMDSKLFLERVRKISALDYDIKLAKELPLNKIETADISETCIICREDDNDMHYYIDGCAPNHCMHLLCALEWAVKKDSLKSVECPLCRNKAAISSKKSHSEAEIESDGYVPLPLRSRLDNRLERSDRLDRADRPDRSDL